MRTALASEAGDFKPPAPASAEEREKLMSLGYLAGGASLPEPGSALPNPRDKIASYTRARAAFALVEQGKDAEAVRAFDAVLQENPGFVDALTERAAALGRLGRYRDSARAYESAIAKAPDLAAPLSLTLARIQLEMGDLGMAQASARKALAAEPATAHELLATIALAQGQLDEAEREAALVKGDSGAEARSAVVAAEVTARRGRPEQALERLQAVSAASGALGPVPWLEFVRGDVLARLGRHAEAETALRAEIDAFPNHARAYASLAIVTALQGRPLAESRGVLDEMNRKAPGPGSRSLAAKALEFIGDGEGAASWRQRSDARVAAR
jgi:tetratricopeptide (TPR) repeat protein